MDNRDIGITKLVELQFKRWQLQQEFNNKVLEKTDVAKTVNDNKGSAIKPKADKVSI